MNNQLWLYCFETYLETTIRKQIILEIIKCLNKTMPANICICKKEMSLYILLSIFGKIEALQDFEEVKSVH